MTINPLGEVAADRAVGFVASDGVQSQRSHWTSLCQRPNEAESRCATSARPATADGRIPTAARYDREWLDLGRESPD